MKKRIYFIIALVLVLALSYGLYYISTIAPIVTGYAAKNLASGIFVANRSQESIEKTDLNFSFIKFNNNSVDYEKKEVISRFLWFKSKAVYIDGFGCTLVREFDEKIILNRRYTKVPLPTFDPLTVAWPAGDLIKDTIPKDINVAKLNEVLTRSFSDEPGSKGTFAVAVAYKNQLISEKYREGFSSKNLFLSWSMAKSFTNALIGILVKKGRIDINKPIDIGAWQKDKRSEITWADLMHMNSGLEWNENYGNLSDVTVMLHKTADMAQFTYEKPLIHQRDSFWQYSSGSTNIASWLIRQEIANERDYYAFPRRELFNPIGMRSAIWETDASGNFVGSSYIYATMRDYVRFGLLYLNDGKWLGNQLLPEGWVDFSVQPANGSDGKYGAFFWLNQSGDYPDVPRDMFMCRGHDGQYIYIIPSLKLVVVRTGFSKKDDFDLRRFLADIVKAIEKK
ncbi:MAG TPA: serine hydrolase [Paludibacter sp.]|nr:serine hydrolase [Paludibacter sp.]